MMSASTVSRSISMSLTARRFSLRPTDGLILLSALVSVLGFVGFAVALNEVGFPLDDSWIHQTYARNLAEYGEWSFVPGSPSAASTAPFYSFLLAFGHLVGLSPFAWAHFLGIVTLAVAGMISARLAERLFPVVPWVGSGTGILIVTTWHIIWAAASGMETMLFMTLSLGVIALAWCELDALATATRAVVRRGAWFGLVSGLLFLTRPEGIALAGLAGLMILGCRVHPARRTFWLWAVGAGIGFVVIVTPYLAFNYAQTDGFLPATASAKIAENAPLRERFILLRYLRMVIPLLAGGQVLWIPAIIWGIEVIGRRIGRREWVLFLPLVWAFAHLSLFVVRLPAPYQHGRYVMPILPPVLLYAVGGMVLLVLAGKDTALKRVLTRTLALSAVAAVLGFWVLGGQAYSKDVRIINTEMVKTAKWIADHPEIIPPTDLLAVHDIGAVGYFAPRDIFDLAGLVSPEVVPIILDHEALMTMMCKKGAIWLMVLPEQQPAADNDPRLELVYSTDEPYIIDAGGKGNMKVFRLRFGDACSTP